MVAISDSRHDPNVCDLKHPVTVGSATVRIVVVRPFVVMSILLLRSRVYIECDMCHLPEGRLEDALHDDDDGEYVTDGDRFCVYFGPAAAVRSCITGQARQQTEPDSY